MEEKKRRRTTVSVALKRAVWDAYIGPAVQEAPCPICGIVRIYQTRNSGFEAAHIVADKYELATELNVTHLYPCCETCNNYCSDLCLLDYMWGRERIPQLRAFIWAVYQAFVGRHVGELDQLDNLTWRVIQHLYGAQRYPGGGGLQNEKQIYELAREVQMTKLAEEAARLSAQMVDNAKTLRKLMESRITPLRLF
jgi:hypothetical protein